MQDAVIGAYRGAISDAYRCEDLLSELSTIRDRVASQDAIVLAEGRNRNVRLVLSSPDGPMDVVVKAFSWGAQRGSRMSRKRGSKAYRTWQAACSLSAAGVGTPAPIAFLERIDGARCTESYFISLCQDAVTSFTDELNDLFRDESICEKFMALMQCVADAVRGMHQVGFQHNDLGNQNILLRRKGDCEWGDVQFIDLNRGRQREELTHRQRARDISRIYLPSDLLRVFMDMYWGGDPPADDFLEWQKHYRRRYAWHTATRRYRHPIRTWRARHAGSDAPTYPLEKDMWIWDERSAQPIVTMISKDRSRYYPVWSHLKVAAATIAGLLPVWRAYSSLRRDAYALPVALKNRVGMSLDPSPDTYARQFALLERLGPIPVLIRFYHHGTTGEWNFSADVVRQLRERGHSVSVAFVQNRDAVLFPDRWCEFIDHVLQRISTWIDAAELGHAINRVKWGFWGLSEYQRFIESTTNVCARYPSVSFTGPAAIDFEYPCVLGALRCVPPNFRFAALSHHLYVDRRGAPENRQGRFSLLEKLALARAIASTSPVCDDRLIISEVNWPIEGTGVYSPVGAPYVSPQVRFNDPSVSEDTYADFMFRYLLIATCSGLVERVYWWRLVARGFGLVDDSNPKEWIERPAFRMLAVFLRTLGDATFTDKKELAEGRAVGYFFETDDKRRSCLAYAQGDELLMRSPFASSEIRSALSEKMTVDAAGMVRVSSRPVYFFEEVAPA